MMFVPESKEVLGEAIEELQAAVALSEASGTPEVALDAFTAKFLQGGLYITQCTTIFLYQLVQWAREEGVDPTFISFQEILFDYDDEDEDDLEISEGGGVDTLDDEDDEGADMTLNILNTLLQDFLNNDAAHFNEVVKSSYFTGFKETAFWFLTLVSIYNKMVGGVDD